jgi:hypothetical protein
MLIDIAKVLLKLMALWWLVSLEHVVGLPWFFVAVLALWLSSNRFWWQQAAVWVVSSVALAVVYGVWFSVALALVALVWMWMSYGQPLVTSDTTRLLGGSLVFQMVLVGLTGIELTLGLVVRSLLTLVLLTGIARGQWWWRHRPRHRLRVAAQPN